MESPGSKSALQHIVHAGFAGQPLKSDVVDHSACGWVKDDRPRYDFVSDTRYSVYLCSRQTVGNQASKIHLQALVSYTSSWTPETVESMTAQDSHRMA